MEFAVGLGRMDVLHEGRGSCNECCTSMLPWMLDKLHEGALISVVYFNKEKV